MLGFKLLLIVFDGEKYLFDSWTFYVKSSAKWYIYMKREQKFDILEISPVIMCMWEEAPGKKSDAEVKEGSGLKVERILGFTDKWSS